MYRKNTNKNIIKLLLNSPKLYFFSFNFRFLFRFYIRFTFIILEYLYNFVNNNYIKTLIYFL